MEMYKQLTSGQMPGAFANAPQNHTDANGNPIIDEEGGAVIQPKAGFVIKTKDTTGGKVFVNFTFEHSISFST